MSHEIIVHSAPKETTCARHWLWELRARALRVSATSTIESSTSRNWISCPLGVFGKSTLVDTHCLNLSPICLVSAVLDPLFVTYKTQRQVLEAFLGQVHVAMRFGLGAQAVGIAPAMVGSDSKDGFLDRANRPLSRLSVAR